MLERLVPSCHGFPSCFCRHGDTELWQSSSAAGSSWQLVLLSFFQSLRKTKKTEQNKVYCRWKKCTKQARKKFGKVFSPYETIYFLIFFPKSPDNHLEYS